MEDQEMKTNIEELETTEPVATTDAATNETKEIVEAEEPKQAEWRGQ